MNSKDVKNVLSDALNVVVIYILTTLLAYVFDLANVHAELLLMIYLLGITIIIIQTKDFLATVFSSVLFVITHDFLFIDPRYVWVRNNRNFIVSSIVFLIVALIINLLVVRLQREIVASKKIAIMHKKLYKAAEGLLAVHGRENVIRYADDVLTELTGSEVEFFFDIDKNEENEAKKWCYKNSAKCGHGEVEFSDAGCKYLPIRSNNKTVGVVSINCINHDITGEEEECVTALLSQITIAIEREELEEANKADLYKRSREHLKAEVTRNMSHEMYPRAKNINKLAKEMRESYNLLDEETILNNLKEIEEESDYAAQLVDNLLDINKND